MRILAIAFILSMTLAVRAAQPGRIETFPLQSIRILGGDFKTAEQTDLNYILSLNPDRLLAPFLREAGLKPKAENYPNWENTGLDGHIGGHYLSALSLMYASTGNEQIRERLAYMLDELRRCQASHGNGYIGGVPGSKALWEEIASGKIEPEAFALNTKWVPLYNIHKTYAGLRDAYRYTGSKLALDMFLQYCDWMLGVTSGLTEQQIQNMLRSEHGGLNEVFADAAAITGDSKYLTLAEKFSHQSLLDPLSRKEDRLNGMHANTQIPKVIGFERIASLGGDAHYHAAALYFWDNVVNTRTCVIGGNSVREHFHPSTDFSTMISSEQGPETCNTYNMLRLSGMLFASEGLEKYMAYYERALYNHILSSQHPVKGGFVYFTPMRPGHYRVYSQSQQSFWCCVGSGMENHARYGELIYAHKGQDLYINLFIPSRLEWKEQGMVLTQQTRFPDEETVRISMTLERPSVLTLQIRYPGWVSQRAMEIRVNGRKWAIPTAPGSYVPITRTWKSGDLITLTLPMNTTTELLPDKSGYAAILRGPIVLAAPADTSAMQGLYADDGRNSHIASGLRIPLTEIPALQAPLEEVPAYIRPVPGKPMTFSAGTLFSPSGDKNRELIPFYRIHDSRYIIYWPVKP